MRTSIGQIVGKAIKNIVVSENDRSPRVQVFLVFDDETYFELYGDDFSYGNHVYPGTLENVLNYAGRGKPRNVHVHPTPEKETLREVNEA